MRWAAFAALALLVACGAEAPPEPPQKAGITIEGELRMGVQAEL